MRGVYVITCVPTGKVYVGHSTRIKDRLEKEHLPSLRAGAHPTKHLQNAWNKYGEDAFAFETLFEMPGATVEELVDAEIEIWTLFSPNVFNAFKPRLPVDFTVEVRRNIGVLHKGRKLSPETKAKISASSKGRRHTPETRVKIGNVMRGRKLSPEHKAKLSEAKRGKKRGPHSTETRAKIGAANKGKIISTETRAKISAAQKGKRRGPPSLETRAKISEAKRASRCNSLI